MKSANSVAAYYYTAGMSLLEAVVHANQQHEPVLITLFDTATQGIHGRLHHNQLSFSISVLLTPGVDSSNKGDVVLNLSLPQPRPESDAKPNLLNSHLQVLHDDNPAGRLLPLLEQVARLQNKVAASAKVEFELSDQTCLTVALDRAP